MERATSGWINGFIGVAIFAGSLPATRVAVADFSPVFLTGVRATIAALLGLALLLAFRQARPSGSDIPALVVTALGVVIGFPLLTALALQHVTSAHSIVFVGILPLCTAIFAVLRAGERPRPVFWLFSLAGASFVVGYAAQGGIEASLQGPLMILSMPLSLSGIRGPAWAGLAYVSLFSMLIGFVFWYRGLVQGGIAAVGQLQLFQPFMGLALAALLLHEAISWTMLVATLGAVICVAGAKRHAG